MKTNLTSVEYAERFAVGAAVSFGVEEIVSRILMKAAEPIITHPKTTVNGAYWIGTGIGVIGVAAGWSCSILTAKALGWR